VNFAALCRNGRVQCQKDAKNQRPGMKAARGISPESSGAIVFQPNLDHFSF
jgi:hypothetical protein